MVKEIFVRRGGTWRKTVASGKEYILSGGLERRISRQEGI